MIKGPSVRVSHPDYVHECQEALENEVVGIFADAESVGWDRGAIGEAISILAWTYMRKGELTQVTQADVARALAALKRPH
ncbi:hypothetical protein [Methylovirgula sp. 4M-Z18]|uniref:hypothetical protein n=1 Tax=Methylovirgula sp. 4M-Z18 TaxID=2293567 RepID=UPI000E2F13FB|nr:hypothetical protein [Methylovirgula sp. 4M-Z18]RFB76282.1 hypothetical protein DYH55_20780 [Methylovirgula sp. 4M-Z18]